jgi:hypothetical protein
MSLVTTSNLNLSRFIIEFYHLSIIKDTIVKITPHGTEST